MGADLNQMLHGLRPRDEDDVELRRQSPSSDSDEGSSSLSDSREEEATSPGSPPPLAKTTTTCLPPKSDAKGPLNELSSLMAQLPIKRGLSKYYEGKSQSYSSLSDVRCLADLPKKEAPCRRTMKSCKSYAGGLDGSPESNNIDQGTSCRTISKKASGGSCASTIATSRSKPPPISVQKNFCLH